MITATNDVRMALTANNLVFGNIDSASLRLEKFIRYGNEERQQGERREWKQLEVEAVCDIHNKKSFLPSSQFHLPTASKLYAKLNSRLIVNQAGGVLENAGLCLHRHFNVPYVPGSAVKGCARRAAIQAILEAVPDEKVELVRKTAITFGWGDNDWKDGKSKKWEGDWYSDFAYACEDAWSDVKRDVCARLAELTGDSRSKGFNKDKPWGVLSGFAGTVSFLTAFPTAKPTLVVDIVNCHHMKYYAGESDVALDNENPNPQFFPAVEAGAGFLFQIVPSSRVRRLSLDFEPAQFAIGSLRVGLEDFGIGAKTAAGYGWMVESDEVKSECETAAKKCEEAARRAEAEKLDKAAEKARIKAAAERKATLASMSDEQKADYEIEQLSDVQFNSFIESFEKRDERVQKALVRALCGSRLTYWIDFKNKATKGKPAQIVNAIRALKKKLDGGKMT